MVVVVVVAATIATECLLRGSTSKMFRSCGTWHDYSLFVGGIRSKQAGGQRQAHHGCID